MGSQKDGGRATRMSDSIASIVLRITCEMSCVKDSYDNGWHSRWYRISQVAAVEPFSWWTSGGNNCGRKRRLELFLHEYGNSIDIWSGIMRVRYFAALLSDAYQVFQYLNTQLPLPFWPGIWQPKRVDNVEKMRQSYPKNFSSWVLETRMLDTSIPPNEAIMVGWWHRNVSLIASRAMKVTFVTTVTLTLLPDWAPSTGRISKPILGPGL